MPDKTEDFETLRMCIKQFVPEGGKDEREYHHPPLRSVCLDVLDEMEEELQRLREALEAQWYCNHSEHCQNKWPHKGDCHWPKPDVLKGEVLHENTNA